MSGSSVTDYEADLQKVLELAKVIIGKDFGGCGLREKVIDRVRELVYEWRRMRLIAERENRTIGEHLFRLRFIFLEHLIAMEYFFFGIMVVYINKPSNGII